MPSRPTVRAAVACSSERPSASRMNGFGIDSRDTGQRRVPAPPHRMIGTSFMRVVVAGLFVGICKHRRGAGRRDPLCDNGALLRAAPRMRQKTALITGVTGQDGAYLARFLL